MVMYNTGQGSSSQQHLPMPTTIPQQPHPTPPLQPYTAGICTPYVLYATVCIIIVTGFEKSHLPCTSVTVSAKTIIIGEIQFIA